jgi:CheY-like chemotaxis protein
VLVVDDHPTNLRILDRMLRGLGCRTVCAADGEAALQHISDGAPFDLVLLDLVMPGRGGLEVAQALPDMLAEPPPVILLTSAGLPGEIDACREAGVAAYLMKPTSRREIEAAMRQVLAPHAPSEPLAPMLTRDDLVTNSRQARLLMAEDNSVNELLAVTLLRRWGHDVTVAKDGAEAVALHAQQAFDLVLMDVHMPGLSGLEATRRMREAEQQSGRPRTPIIAVTASAMEEDRRRCLAAGMDDYLSKPLRARDLLHALERHLPRQQAQEGRSQAYRNGLAQADVQTVQIIAAPFLAELPKELAAMDHAIATGDATALAHRAHSMKGLLLAFGAQPAVRLAQQLQQHAEAQPFDSDQAQDCLADLRDEMRLLEPHLRAVGQAPAQTID